MNLSPLCYFVIGLAVMYLLYYLYIRWWVELDRLRYKFKTRKKESQDGN